MATSVEGGTAFQRFMQYCAGLAESHPYVWAAARTLVRNFPPLLPHDRGYYAFRHFIAARPNGLFLDCGANDGISALGFRKFDASYQILSIEPNSQHVRALQKIANRDKAFRYLIAGCGETPGRITFHVPVYRGIVLHTFASSHRDTLRDMVRRYYGDGVAAAVHFHTVEADMIRIDDLHIAPSIVKIDAEGADAAVLRGADRTIREARPFIVIEIGDERADTPRYFQELNYVLRDYDPTTDKFQPVGASQRHSVSRRNVMAIPEEYLDQMPHRE